MTDIAARPVSRGSLLRGAGAAGAGVMLGGGLLSAATARAAGGVTKGDIDILIAAEIAEALAVTTYTTIINRAPFFKRLAADDQGYLKAARQEEMSHYALEMSVTGKPSPFTTFYYPHGMFKHAHTTLNTLVTLEDAFIAAYLVGVRNFSNSDLRVTAARIMGIESDHRTLARVVGPGVAKRDGGPIEHITGSAGRRRVASIRRTTTATSARSSGRRSARPSRLCCPSSTRPRPPRPGSTPTTRSTSTPSRRTCPISWAHFTGSAAEASLRTGTRVRDATPSGVAHPQLSL